MAHFLKRVLSFNALHQLATRLAEWAVVLEMIRSSAPKTNLSMSEFKILGISKEFLKIGQFTCSRHAALRARFHHPFP